MMIVMHTMAKAIGACAEAMLTRNQTTNRNTNTDRNGDDEERETDKESQTEKPHATVIKDNSTLCSICGTARTEPAVAKHCGHVFCWSCLYEWTKRRRPECPFCRTPCQPQEVMALYQYA